MLASAVDTAPPDERHHGRMIVGVGPGDRLVLESAGGPIEVQLLHKSGRAARLAVTAPPQVEITLERASALVPIQPT